MMLLRNFPGQLVRFDNLPNGAIFQGAATPGNDQIYIKMGNLPDWHGGVDMQCGVMLEFDDNAIVYYLPNASLVFGTFNHYE